MFPPLFQQVYTDNIITHKNPEWFAPLLMLYTLLFVLTLTIWIALSVVRRTSYARIIIDRSSDYLWAVIRLPMTVLSRFTPGELVARYAGINKTVKSLGSEQHFFAGWERVYAGCVTREHRSNAGTAPTPDARHDSIYYNQHCCQMNK